MLNPTAEVPGNCCLLGRLTLLAAPHPAVPIQWQYRPAWKVPLLLYSSIKPTEVPYNSGVGVQGFYIVIPLWSQGQA